MASLSMVASLALVVGSGTAQAEPTTAAEAKVELEKIEQEHSQLELQYNQVHQQLTDAQGKLAQTEADIASQREQVEAARVQVTQIALQKYQDQGVSSAAVILVSPDTESLLNQMSTMQQVEATSMTILQNYEAQSAQLQDLERSAETAVASVQAEEERLREVEEAGQVKVDEARAVLDRLSAEEAAALAAAQAAQEAAAASELGITVAPAATSTGTADAPASTAAAVVPAGDGSRASQVVAFAYSRLGYAYRYGGEGPSSYDCSGLTLVAYRNVGVSLPHRADWQFDMGVSVPISQLQPGDLVFYYPGISHVAIYVGDGMVIHASNERTGVIKTSLTYSGYPQGARRYV
jgi:cell wall-associated NlpC family hydrolase